MLAVAYCSPTLMDFLEIHKKTRAFKLRALIENQNFDDLYTARLGLALLKIEEQDQIERILALFQQKKERDRNFQSLVLLIEDSCDESRNRNSEISQPSESKIQKERIFKLCHEKGQNFFYSTEPQSLFNHFLLAPFHLLWKQDRGSSLSTDSTFSDLCLNSKITTNNTDCLEEVSSLEKTQLKKNQKELFVKMIRQRFLRLDKKNLLLEKLHCLNEFLSSKKVEMSQKNFAEEILLIYEIARITVHDSLIREPFEAHSKVQRELYYQIGPLASKLFTGNTSDCVLKELSQWHLLSPKCTSRNLITKSAQLCHLFFEAAQGAFHQSKSGFTFAKVTLLNHKDFFSSDLIYEFIHFYDNFYKDPMPQKGSVGTDIASNKHMEHFSLFVNR